MLTSISAKYPPMQNKEGLKCIPENVSAAQCQKCGTFYPEVYHPDAYGTCRVTQCFRCGEEYSYPEARTLVRPYDYECLDEMVTLSRTWYHATSNHEWDSDIKNLDRVLLVHLGSKASAMTRAMDYRRFTDTKVHLFAVNLTDQSTLYPHFVEDRNEWPDYMDELSHWKIPEKKGSNTFRYVNDYEHPGAVSLLASVQAFEVVGRKKLWG